MRAVSGWTPGFAVFCAVRTASVKSTVLAICLCWWTAGVPVLAQTEPPDVYAEAASAFQQGKLQLAEQILRTALTSQPDRPDLLGLLALVLDAKKEYDEASELHQRALKLAPRSAGLWNNFGNHYLAQGDDVQAQKAFLRVVGKAGRSLLLGVVVSDKTQQGSASVGAAGNGHKDRAG